MNKFFEPPSKIDYNEPNREEREFFDRIRKIIELITLIDENHGQLDHVINKDCQKHLKDLKRQYDTNIDAITKNIDALNTFSKKALAGKLIMENKITATKVNSIKRTFEEIESQTVLYKLVLLQLPLKNGSPILESR